MIKRIEIERKKAELEHIEELTRARRTRNRAEAEAEARVKAAEAEAAEARRAQKLAEARAEAEEIEALSKLRMEAINLKAEEQLIACSVRGSFVALSMVKSLFRQGLEKEKLFTVRGGEVCCSQVKTVSPGFEPGCSPSAETKPFVLPESSIAATCYNVADVTRSEMKMNVDCQPVVCEPRVRGGMCVSNGFRDNYLGSHVNERKINSEALPFYSQQLNDKIKRHEPPHQLAPSSSRDTNESILCTCLDRQGRNEYINLASQIAYDGSNIAFVFYENQIRRLMEESSYDDRKLEVLRASCVGQPREMVNLFCAPMKNMSTNQRIEKAIDRLR